VLYPPVYPLELAGAARNGSSCWSMTTVSLFGTHSVGYFCQSYVAGCHRSETKDGWTLVRAAGAIEPKPIHFDDLPSLIVELAAR
jgi:hypothetical protein